jgi:hypothetical protein
VFLDHPYSLYISFLLYFTALIINIQQNLYFTYLYYYLFLPLEYKFIRGIFLSISLAFITSMKHTCVSSLYLSPIPSWICIFWKFTKRFGKFSVILLNMFSMSLAHVSSPSIPFFLLMVSHKFCMFYLYFLFILLSYCLIILIHLPCLWALIFCLLLDSVEWLSFQLSF